MSTTWINRGHFYVPHVTPVVVDCNFAVTPTNGLGITSLKGQGVQNVFMHTSTTPTAGSNGVLNPNPPSGYIYVQLADNFSKYYGGFSQVHGPNSGSDVKIDNSALTANSVYVISVLGDATLAKWRAIGVPAGVVPAVGVPFVAASNGGAGNTLTSRVQLSATGGSGIYSIENVGGPNLGLSPIPVGSSAHVGGWLMFKCLGGSAAAPALTMDSYTPAGTNNSATPPIFTGTPAVLTGSVAAPAISSVATAPAAGSVIRMAFYMSQSSVVVSGE